MKTSFLALAVTLAFVSSGFTQSATQSAEKDAAQAAKSAEKGVEKAAKKTGDAVKDAVEKTGDAAGKAADKAGKGLKKVGSDITNSELYQKIEKELGKPFTPEQQQKYADAWKAAKEKTGAAEKEFADKLSEITGIGKKKTKKIVSESDL